MTYQLGDPRISKDNSMQMKVPGTQLILDATGLDESMGKAQFMNDCLNFDTAGARIRQAPGLNYCLAYALPEIWKSRPHMMGLFGAGKSSGKNCLKAIRLRPRRPIISLLT